jgi:Protein of unknown function (DUF2442)
MTVATAIDVHCDADALRITLADGRELSASMERFPRLRNATFDQRARWRLIGRGEGIHWPDIDEDISVDTLLELSSLERGSALAKFARAGKGGEK